MKENIFCFLKTKSIPHYLLLLFLLLLIMFAFRDLPQSFFEQDEWHSFGHYNYLLSLNTSDLIINALRSGPFNHFTPLSLFSKLTMFKVFGLNAEYYFYVSIFLHFLVAAAVYFLVYLVLERKLPAFLSSIFFAINSSHHQAVTWIGTFEGAELSVLFGVLSLCSFLRYRKIDRKKWFYLTLLCLFISLLFKETAISFFIILGALVMISQRRIKGSLIGIGGVALAYLLLKFNYLFFKTASVGTALDQSKVDFFQAFIYNIMTVPIKIFAQLVLPNDIMIGITSREAFSFNPNIGPWTLEYAFFYDLLSFSSGALIIIIIYLIAKRSKYKFSIYLGVAIIVANIMPLLIIRKYLTYLDSRYLYQATVGLGLIIGFVCQSVLSDIKIGKIGRRFVSLGFLSCALVIYFLHFYSLQGLIERDREVGNIRENILVQIKRGYPQLPEETVFYTQSDSTYYGIGEERILPFQSGFGQTLLVWYSVDDKLPKEFFEGDFLWDIKSQGYKEAGQRGFGYFRDFTLLKKAVKDYNIPVSSVIAFSWDKQSTKLVDTSYQTRIQLLGELK